MSEEEKKKRSSAPHRGEGEPASDAILRLTNKCNQMCVFCCQEGREWGCDPSLDEIKEELRKARTMGAQNVTFMQGESTTRKDFVEILNAVRESGFENFGFATNGTLLSDKEFLRAVLATGVKGMEFSIHSHIEEVANLISGRPFTHRKQWQALRNFAELRTTQRIVFNIVVCRHNHGHIKELIGELARVFPDGDFALNIKYPLIMGMVERELDLLVPYDRLDLAPLLEFLTERKIEACFDNFPPCIVPGFEHRVIKTIDLVTSHKYLSRPVDGGEIEDAGTFTQGYKHVPACKACSLKPICAGVYAKYMLAFGSAPVKPTDIPVEPIVRKVLTPCE